jgi:hypothetical protein
MSIASALSSVFRNGPSIGPFQRRERVSTSDNENEDVVISLNNNTGGNAMGIEAMEEGSFINSRNNNRQSSISETAASDVNQNRSGRLNLSSGSADVSNHNNNNETVSSLRRSRVVAVRRAATGNRTDSNINSNTEQRGSESTGSHVDSGNDIDISESAATATPAVSSMETDGLHRFTVSAQRATVTLAELEEERELARRRSTACVLFALFILFRLWIMALQEADMGLFLVCLIGTSWTARWISYNREQEEELDRRIANYIESSNNTTNGTNNADNAINRNDLRLLSFQGMYKLSKYICVFIQNLSLSM